MKLNIINNGNLDHEELLLRVLKERILVDLCEEGMKLSLNIDESLEKKESYRITEIDGGWQVDGSDSLGLYFGIGKLLHTAKWSDKDFVPNPPAGVISPDCSLRVIYIANHFYNWYMTAPAETIVQYMEELILWGFNALLTGLPTVNAKSHDDPLITAQIGRVKTFYDTAKKYGLQILGGGGGNQTTGDLPEELRATYENGNWTNRGFLGTNACYSKPAAVEFLRNKRRKSYEFDKKHFDVTFDYAMSWPYDEGGCGCKDCYPWGGNKYLEVVKDVYQTVKEFNPNAKFIVSTWAFDYPEDEGEYAALYKRLNEDLSFVDYLLIDSHTEFPRYPLTHEPVKPIINFPEISMWELYPWGGFGANPLPERFQNIWDECKHIISGGEPYSEGRYEDISKIQFIGYYWDKDRDYRDILREYINYELDIEAYDDIMEMIACIEKNHVVVGHEGQPDLPTAERAAELAKKIDGYLSERAKNAWRWRYLYIRAILDEKRYRYYLNHNMKGADDSWLLRYCSGVFLLKDQEAQDLLAELRVLSSSLSPINVQNRHTLPPLNGCVLISDI